MCPTNIQLTMAADIMISLFPLRVPTQLLLIRVSNPHHTKTHTHTHTHTQPLSSNGYLNKKIKADENITQSHISQRIPSKIFKDPEGETELFKMTNFLQSKSS